MKETDFRRDLLPLKDKLFRLALRVTLNRQEAEDLTQDTLLRVWSKRGELGEVDNLEAYCVTVCRNLSLDLVARKEHGTLQLDCGEAETLDSTPSAQEQMERDERLGHLHRTLNALPEKMRTAVQLRDIEEMTYREAAEAMGVSEADFKVTLHRARKALREALLKE